MKKASLSCNYRLIALAYAESDFLFDFTAMDNLDDWYETSDVIREPGKSKSSFVLQKTQLFQRAVFFALLNPQPDGSGFAGVDVNITADFSAYSGLELQLRSQSRDIYQWKVYLQTPDSYDRFTRYTQTFEVMKKLYFE